MTISTSVRRAGAALVASALAASLVAVGSPAQAAPADRGAHWLSNQLTNGLVHNDQFDADDYGLSIDTAFALQAIGGHRPDVRRVRNAMAQHVGEYIGTGGEQYAGPIAKLLLFVQSSGADQTNFGGVDLVKRLNHRVIRSGPAKGRIADRSQYGDFANTIGQILAVRGLRDYQSKFAGAAQRFLLKQQCHAGYFRLNFSKRHAARQSCGKRSVADPDTTSYAVVQLWKISKSRPALRRAMKHAVSWLEQQQRRGGAFVGGASTDVPNSNSTGLAAWALAKAHRCGAARSAAMWVSRLQVGPKNAGPRLAAERGAIAYDKKSLRSGERHGITVRTQDQWRRATAQAAPGLRFRHGC
jgi:hypothetical protein